MAYPNCTSTDVLNLVSACLQRASLPANYATIVNQQFNRANADLWMVMADRGYSSATLDAWDDSATYVIQLACYYSLGMIPALANYPEFKEQANDPRKMLVAMAAIRSGGVAVAPQPGDSAVGGISFGDSQAAECAIRRYDDLGYGGYGCIGGPWVG